MKILKLTKISRYIITILEQKIVKQDFIKNVYSVFLYEKFKC